MLYIDDLVTKIKYLFFINLFFKLVCIKSNVFELYIIQNYIAINICLKGFLYLDFVVFINKYF